MIKTLGQEGYGIGKIHIFRRPKVGQVAPHIHDCIELVYISSGEGMQMVNGKSRQVTKGELLFYNIGELHCLNSNTEVDAVNIQIYPEMLDGSLVASNNAIDLLTLGWFCEFSRIIEGFPPKVSFTGKDLLEIEFIITRMKDEYDQKKTGYLSVIYGYLNVLFAKLFRQIYAETKLDVRENVGQITPDVLSYIEKNYNNRITIQELARRNFYNPSYFVQIFKECFGMTPLQYINHKRINKAMELLEDTDMPVEEVMHSVGFSDKKHFYSIFKQNAGVTPATYREKTAKTLQ